MKRREFLVSSLLGSVGALGAVGVRASHLPLSHVDGTAAMQPASPAGAAGRKILIAGGGFGEAFIRYMASLTGKRRPRLCYLPTAAADRPDVIVTWFKTCGALDVVPFVQESFIASTRQHRVGKRCCCHGLDCRVGGNTLIIRRSGIQGSMSFSAHAWIDGSSCAWPAPFVCCSRSTRTRTSELTTVTCLGFLKGIFPHTIAKPRAGRFITADRFGLADARYACDNDAESTSKTRGKGVVSSPREAKVY